MNQHEKLNYVEFPAKDIESTKMFFEKAFSWHFVDYGPDYTSFSAEGLDGGFYRIDLSSTEVTGGALLIFYSENIEETQKKVESSGGKIIKPVFEFPGGRRFQFLEPSGNELAVWSDK